MERNAPSASEMSRFMDGFAAAHKTPDCVRVVIPNVVGPLELGVVELVARRFPKRGSVGGCGDRETRRDARILTKRDVWREAVWTLWRLDKQTPSSFRTLGLVDRARKPKLGSH